MINKRIFYCWFGKGHKTQLNIDCIKSWKKYCPDYEIIEINENNFDYKCTPYSEEGYLKGNWSAVSNTARLEILHNENGFYLDTDIMLLKSLDQLREYDGGFISEYDAGQPDVGILGRGSTNPKLFEMAREHMIKGTVMHKVFLRDLYSLYDIHGESIHTFNDGFTVLGEEFIPNARKKFKTNDTIALHYFENSWINHPIKVTDKFYPFQKIRAFIDNNLVYEDINPVIDVSIINKDLYWKNMKILGRMNYFFNPKVIKIETEDFIANRINFDKNKETSITTTASGMIVTHMV